MVNADPFAAFEETFRDYAHKFLQDKATRGDFYKVHQAFMVLIFSWTSTLSKLNERLCTVHTNNLRARLIPFPVPEGTDIRFKGQRRTYRFELRVFAHDEADRWMHIFGYGGERIALLNQHLDDAGMLCIPEQEA